MVKEGEMALKTENLIKFFDQIKTITFWQRVFRWGQIRSLSYEAYEEFKKLTGQFEDVESERDRVKGDLDIAINDQKHLKESFDKQILELEKLGNTVDFDKKEITRLNSELSKKEEALRQLEPKLTKAEADIAGYKEKNNSLAEENKELKKENNAFNQTEEDRKSRYEENVSSLNALRADVKAERDKEREDAHKEEIAKMEAMKATWGRHEDNVRDQMKAISLRLSVEYIDKVPFTGKPDNTVKICNQFVVFDAKSPASSDLSNFPDYLKNQADGVKKYVSQENVWKQVFLVVPTNTLEILDTFTFDKGEYRVHVVAADALEPILAMLKRLEAYEFAEQLAPEVRDDLCRVVGALSHLTKRRIQIDQYFGRHSLDVLSMTSSRLPEEFATSVEQYEKVGRLNPSVDKSGKLVDTINKLEQENDKIKIGACVQGIAFPEELGRAIDSTPLNKPEQKDGHPQGSGGEE